MAPETKRPLEKAAYTAVGAPIAAVKAIGARVSDLRDAIGASRSDLSEELASEFDAWVAEGERVVSKTLERLRESGAIDRARSTAQRMKETVEASIEEMSETFDVVEPEHSMTLIRGIGPATADRLASAGVPGITAFLEMTETRSGLEELAAATGYSTQILEGWREQADLSRVTGVGDRYRRLLHRLGIWTVDQLADADPESVSSEIETVDIPGMPDQTPGSDQISKWVGAAKKLR